MLVARLKKLQKDYNIDGFKFDAGEPCFLPQRFTTHKPIDSPTEYTCLYVQEVASRFSFAEVRNGHRTTNVPLFSRMGDRFSTWSTENALRSLIPTLLTSGLLGYPFCLPDMIGGNAYFGRKPVRTDLPDKRSVCDRGRHHRGTCGGAGPKTSRCLPAQVAAMSPTPTKGNSRWLAV